MQYKAAEHIQETGFMKFVDCKGKLLKLYGKLLKLSVRTLSCSHWKSKRQFHATVVSRCIQLTSWNQCVRCAHRQTLISARCSVLCTANCCLCSQPVATDRQHLAQPTSQTIALVLPHCLTAYTYCATYVRAGQIGTSRKLLPYFRLICCSSSLKLCFKMVVYLFVRYVMTVSIRQQLVTVGKYWTLNCRHVVTETGLKRTKVERRGIILYFFFIYILLTVHLNIFILILTNFMN